MYIHVTGIFHTYIEYDMAIIFLQTGMSFQEGELQRSFRGDDWTKGQERAARLERDKKKLTLGERCFAMKMGI